MTLKKTPTSNPSPMKFTNKLLIDPQSPYHGKKTSLSYQPSTTKFARIVLSVTYDTPNNVRITKLMMK